MLFVLGVWISLIFIATLVGCYIPLLILLRQNHLWKHSEESSLIKHHERNEVAMSYLMSFSGGVCLAVAFAFQMQGTAEVIQGGKTGVVDAASKSSLVTASTFVLFFLVEQIGSVLQDWHARNCAGIAPCAVEVASQPLEAASVLRTLTEHKDVAPRDLQCLSYRYEPPARTAPTLPTLSYPLIEATRSPPQTQSPPQSPPQTQSPPQIVPCQFCSVEASEDRRRRRNSQGGWFVLSFLLGLFALHSLAEGLGLGTAAAAGRQAQTVALAILLHKTLSAFAVGAALLRCQVSQTSFGLIAVVFSAMSPIGALLGYAITRSGQKDQTPSVYGGYCSLVAAGTFMFIALVEFLPKSFDEGVKSDISIAARLSKVVLFLAGALSVTVTMMWAEE